jgi:hypothetical protein
MFPFSPGVRFHFLRGKAADFSGPITETPQRSIFRTIELPSYDSPRHQISYDIFLRRQTEVG